MSRPNTTNPLPAPKGVPKFVRPRIAINRASARRRTFMSRHYALAKIASSRQGAWTSLPATPTAGDAPMTEQPVVRVSGHRGWRLAVLVAALIAVAGIPASAQARAPADLGGEVAGSDPGELTGLVGSVLTHPRVVRGT